MLEIGTLEDPDKVAWSLPPSKSHMIRWLALSSQCPSNTELHFEGVPGKDVEVMANCMEFFGAEISRESGKWIIGGNPSGSGAPIGNLWCGNSGTAARVVTAMAAAMGTPTSIDGDDSLRGRDGSALSNALRNIGCNISSESLPCTVEGALHSGSVEIDLSESSQALTAFLLASPRFPHGIEAKLLGKPVSRDYSELTVQICKTCGWSGSISERVPLEPWEVNTPGRVDIPGELSLLPLSILFDALHGTDTNARLPKVGFPRVLESIGSVIQCGGGRVDLRDASDIITPAAFLMALGDGGKIFGASHSRGKESDRIQSTASLLREFGIDAKDTADGFEIMGGQELKKPEGLVRTYSDHRVAMTAIVLATKVGGVIEGSEWCEISHPGFVKMICNGRG